MDFVGSIAWLGTLHNSRDATRRDDLTRRPGSFCQYNKITSATFGSIGECGDEKDMKATEVDIRDFCELSIHSRAPPRGIEGVNESNNRISNPSKP